MISDIYLLITRTLPVSESKSDNDMTSSISSDIDTTGTTPPLD